MTKAKTGKNYEEDTEVQDTCCVCGVLLDSFDDTEFTCSDLRCQRTWENRVDAAEDRRIQRLMLEQEQD